VKFANGGLTCKIESTTSGIIMVHEVQTVGSSGSHTILDSILSYMNLALNQ